ncbi:hypothetical protein MHBO_000301 [Bonamia ostreae]
MQLDRAFLEMGYNGPRVFQLYDFRFYKDDSQDLELLKKLPLLIMRYKFIKKDQTNLNVMLFLSDLAKSMLNHSEDQIIESINNSDNNKETMPFLWRCFSPSSWDVLLQLEQLSCGGVTPLDGFQLKISLLTKDGTEIPCCASVRYKMNKDKIFESVEYYMVPIISQENLFNILNEKTPIGDSCDNALSILESDSNNDFDKFLNFQ